MIRSSSFPANAGRYLMFDNGRNLRKSIFNGILTSCVVVPNRKLGIYPVKDKQFTISLYTPEEKRMISFVVGAVDFGYNQVRLQNLMINGRSIQSVIKSDDDSNTVIATDTSIYTTATVDKIINELTLSFNSKIAALEARIATLEG